MDDVRDCVHGVRCTHYYVTIDIHAFSTVSTIAHNQWITHRCNIFVHQIFHGGRDFLKSFGHRLVVRDDCTTAVCVRIGSISTNEQRVLRGTGFEKLDLRAWRGAAGEQEA